MTNSAVRMGSKLSADDRRVQQTHLSYDGEDRLSTLTEEGMKNLLLGSTSKERKNRFHFLIKNVDDEPGLVYYNYRHFNPLDGK